jgi:hypothetical protein
VFDVKSSLLVHIPLTYSADIDKCFVVLSCKTDYIPISCIHVSRPMKCVIYGSTAEKIILNENHDSHYNAI